MSETAVTGEQCEYIRTNCTDRVSPYELARELDVERNEVMRHVTGECAHDTDPAASYPRSAFNVSADECASIRRRYDEGESVEELFGATGRRWGTLVRHLTGNCTHGPTGAGPTVDKETILRRDSVSAERCREFRIGVREAGNVMEFAESSDASYQVILAHVNGECSHDVDIAPREAKTRSSDLSGDVCREIRTAWRGSTELDFETLADDFGYSTATVERHVKFRCSHPPVDTIVTDVDEVDDVLEASESTGIESIATEEILAQDSVRKGDPVEASQDLAPPEGDHVDVTRSRILRNTEIAHELKEMYDHECQICGERRRRADGEPYAEAHHVRPLGEPHGGPDTPDNILVVCPNHHADLDYGRVRVDPETLRVGHDYETEVDGVELTVEEAHDLDEEFLRYHAAAIASVESGAE